eukprot:CAMPEP_0117865206 /NCGR_PEP_ID=MMETSP0950-20121206/6599_1 /TAXON_ID=44440 /ORGANISM="Chattonella subsalsa, Strain CCMP2191" /LENGTH=72 /DNA_ID=CAMNT_0005716243 /DNA_START=318 /DNA_END=533 /DNA_ORIENTATION=-
MGCNTSSHRAVKEQNTKKKKERRVAPEEDGRQEEAFSAALPTYQQPQLDADAEDAHNTTNQAAGGRWKLKMT